MRQKKGKKREDIKSQKRKQVQRFLGLLVIFLLVLAIADKRKVDRTTDGPMDGIVRNAPGKGSSKLDLSLSVEGLIEEEAYQVEIENEHLSMSETSELLELAGSQLEQVILGENRSLTEVRSNLYFPETLMDGLVNVSYHSTNHRLVNHEGVLQQDVIPKQGELVQIQVTLSYEDTEMDVWIPIMVCPRVLSEKEALYQQIEEAIAKENEGSNQVFHLPTKIGNYDITWSYKKDKTGWKILALLLLAIPVSILAKQRDAQNRVKKREIALEREYPCMVRKLALLVGAGMTASSGWERIVKSYEKRQLSNLTKKRKIEPLYEEMRFAYRQMQEGIGERDCYEAFARRLGLLCYSRFVALLIQNLRKGGGDLAGVLEKEAYTAYEKQRNEKLKIGEEAGTKILGPMMCMLLIVIVVIMIPATSTMNL